MFSTVIADVLGILSILGILAGGIRAASKLRAVTADNQRAAAMNITERARLASELAEMTKDRDYERSRADDLQKLINQGRIGGSR